MSSSSDEVRSNGNGIGVSLAQHLNWSSIPVEKPAPGIERQMVVGHQMMICRFRFEPFLVTPEHDHPHEQMTIVEIYRGRIPRWPLLVLWLTLLGCSVSSGLEGSLPDGTSYVLKGEPISRENVTGVHAVVTVDGLGSEGARDALNPNTCR